MAGGDELSARLRAAERVSLPVRLKQRSSRENPYPTDTDIRAAEAESESVGVGCFSRSRSRSRQNLPTPTDSRQTLIPVLQKSVCRLFNTFFSTHIFVVDWLHL